MVKTMVCFGVLVVRFVAYVVVVEVWVEVLFLILVVYLGLGGFVIEEFGFLILILVMIRKKKRLVSTVKFIFFITI